MGEVLGGYGCGNNIGPNVGPIVGPIVGGGCCGPVGGLGLGGSTGAILVLFILLVIITKALWV